MTALLDRLAILIEGGGPKAQARLELGLALLLLSVFGLFVLQLYAWADRTDVPVSPEGTRVVQIHINTSP